MRSKKAAPERKAATDKTASASMPAFASSAARYVSRFLTAPRAAAVVVVMIFVTAAILMASRGPSSATAATNTAKTADTASAAAPVAPAYGSKAESGRVVAPVTITGCLEQKDDAFRLKNTEGEDAPKARSWKSGFLHKGSASVSVVDSTSTNRLKFANHVGERVSVTGTLIDREMKVKSMQRVAAGCN